MASNGKRGADLVVTGLAALGGGLVVLGVGVAVFVKLLPRFVPHHSPPREAQSNLRAAFTSHKEFFQEKDRFGDSFFEVGFEPERGNRYAYFMAEDGPTQDRTAPGRVPVAKDTVVISSDGKWGTVISGPFSKTGCTLTLTRAHADGGVPLKLGRVHTSTEDDAVVVAAVGNIDDDPTLDCWSVATVDRVADGGMIIEAGSAFQEQDDFEH